MATIILRLDDQPDGSMTLRAWNSNHRNPWDLQHHDRTSAERYATVAHDAMHDLQNMADAAGMLIDES